MTYPDGLNVQAWEEWIQFRKDHKMKAYKTNRPAKALLKMAIDFDEQRAIIEQSMDKCWQGLFPVKKKKPETRKERNIEAVKEALCVESQVNLLLKHF